jgi:hypothetical protein
LYKVEQLPPIRQFVVPGRVPKSGQTAAFHFGETRTAMFVGSLSERALG